MSFRYLSYSLLFNLMLKYMYEQEKIKIILGQSISFPNSEQLIGRVTTALPREDIIDHMSAMNRCLRRLR